MTRTRLRFLARYRRGVPSDDERLARIRDWNEGMGGDQEGGWEYLYFDSEAEYRVWAERVDAPPLLDAWDPVRLDGAYNP